MKPDSLRALLVSFSLIFMVAGCGSKEENPPQPGTKIQMEKSKKGGPGAIREDIELPKIDKTQK